MNDKTVQETTNVEPFDQYDEILQVENFAPKQLILLCKNCKKHIVLNIDRYLPKDSSGNFHKCYNGFVGVLELIAYKNKVVEDD